MKTVKRHFSAEITVKRSRFIADIFFVENEEDVKNRVKEIKNKYYDAKHHCYAYVLKDGFKTNDDGEPHGTAGKPILEPLIKNDMVNVLIVVTRYFGGVLLGTGGLSRAYSDSAAAVLNISDIKDYSFCTVYKVCRPYDDYAKHKSALQSFGGIVSNENFAETVTAQITVKEENKEQFERKYNDFCNGNAKLEKICEKFCVF